MIPRKLPVLILLVLAGCTSSGDERGKRQIIHVKNWHFVSQEDFAVDQRELSPEPLSDDMIASRYADFLREVEIVQEEQLGILRKLIRDHGLRRVCYEGVTDENASSFRSRIAELRDFDLVKHRSQIARIEAVIAETPVESDAHRQAIELKRRLQETEAMYRADMLQIGAIGKLMMAGELEDVIPLDDSTLLKRANPVRDQSVRFDADAVARREEEMARRLVSSNEVVTVAVLGGAHDLTAAIAKLSAPPSYTIIEPDSYARMQRRR